jgi:threonine dehydratase
MSYSLKHVAEQIGLADIRPLAKRTNLEFAAQLSEANGQKIWLKREDQQAVFSFKIRGAANRISKLSHKERTRGVVAASAGNHAQGIAAAAAHFNMDAIIFMPITTPSIKTKAVEAHGATIQLVGDSYDEACEAAIEHASKTGALFIHPFDELDVIAGQGTIGQEILDQLAMKPAAVYVAVGGGGLVAGIGAYLRIHSPETKIYAVEPEGAATLKTSLSAGKPTALNRVDGFADGVAVKQIGAVTFDLAQKIKPVSILVSSDEICAAAKSIFEQTRTVVEPAGALALAGLLAHAQSDEAPRGDVVAIVTGANVNFDRIGHMVERAELGGGREILFAASLPEEPGSFLRFCQALGEHAVSEFNYRFADTKTAHVLVGVKTQSPKQGENLMQAIRDIGMTVTDMSGNALAKEHLRHMVGGRATSSVREVIYSFEFPERPGALRDFLTALDGRWNISLFHYRNHGAAAGQVLCGFQIPNDDADALEASLQQTGFSMRVETDNPAYQYFLKS